MQAVLACWDRVVCTMTALFFFFFFNHRLYSGQAVVTSKCHPVSPPVRPFVSIAHRVQHSRFSSIFIKTLSAAHSRVLSASQFQAKKSPDEYVCARRDLIFVGTRTSYRASGDADVAHDPSVIAHRYLYIYIHTYPLAPRHACYYYVRTSREVLRSCANGWQNRRLVLYVMLLLHDIPLQTYVIIEVLGGFLLEAPSQWDATGCRGMPLEMPLAAGYRGIPRHRRWDLAGCYGMPRYPVGIRAQSTAGTLRGE